MLKYIGILSFLPVVLFSGPFLGFLIGDFLERKFASPKYLIFVLITLGFIASAIEVYRIIKFVFKGKD